MPCPHPDLRTRSSATVSTVHVYYRECPIRTAYSPPSRVTIQLGDDNTGQPGGDLGGAGCAPPIN
ncbi:hypothetical protein GCM10022226_73850 [Sphaerisporangium flaviroseum]|uniref:Uncharacterized protein n=1 Tax=Sphaerisporangium flaviroseum TaxID=509199 RepID=A0ABP7JBV6_9ACTN